MDTYFPSEEMMHLLIYFHLALLAVPCAWVSIKVMYEELKDHEISWRIRPVARPVGGIQWV